MSHHRQIAQQSQHIPVTVIKSGSKAVILQLRYIFSGFIQRFFGKDRMECRFTGIRIHLVKGRHSFQQINQLQRALPCGYQ